MRWMPLLSGSLLVVASAAAAQSSSDPSLRSVDEFASIKDKRARSVALFEEAGKVILHPRCVNCHPRTDRPLQGDAGQPHQPLVVRGRDGHGAVAMACTTCHGTNNFTTTPTFSIPGNPKWQLAPIEMAWEGRTLGQICTQIKDPKRNGGKSMKQIVDHMAHDELVGWGWTPGTGRVPVPGTQSRFGDLIEAWAGAGAHCPA